MDYIFYLHIILNKNVLKSYVMCVRNEHFNN